MLIRAEKKWDEVDDTLLGLTVFYNVGGDIRSLFLPQAEIDGLAVEEIKALALSRADASPPWTGNTLFNVGREGQESLRNLPKWATWTGQEAADYVHVNVLSGMDKAQVEAWIETNVTDLPSAKAALKTLASEMVDLRDIVENAARAIMYLRDIAVGE